MPIQIFNGPARMVNILPVDESGNDISSKFNPFIKEVDRLQRCYIDRTGEQIKIVRPPKDDVLTDWTPLSEWRDGANLPFATFDDLLDAVDSILT